MLAVKSNKVLILTGPGGSGKTTIAELLEKRYDFVRLNADREDTEFFANGKQWLPENSKKLSQAHDKILKKAKALFNTGHNVIVDYIIFGDYLNFFQKFNKEFGNALEIKVLFPSRNEIVFRDSKRESWVTGADRIKAVYDELDAIKNKIGEDKYLDTSGQTPEETLEKYFHY